MTFYCTCEKLQLGNGRFTSFARHDTVSRFQFYFESSWTWILCVTNKRIILWHVVVWLFRVQRPRRFYCCNISCTLSFIINQTHLLDCEINSFFPKSWRLLRHDSLKLLVWNRQLGLFIYLCFLDRTWSRKNYQSQDLH